MARKDMLMFFKSVVFGVVDFISDFRLLIFCLMSTTVEIQYYGVAMIFVMLGCMVTSAVGLYRKEEKRWYDYASISVNMWPQVFDEKYLFLTQKSCVRTLPRCAGSLCGSNETRWAIRRELLSTSTASPTSTASWRGCPSASST